MIDALSPLAPTQPTVIAFGTVNGCTPRTLSASLLADAVRRCGVRVLVSEGGLSSTGLGTAFGVPPGVPSYLQARAQAPATWASPEVLRSLLVPSAATGADPLLARAAGTQRSADLMLNDWARLQLGQHSGRRHRRERTLRPAQESAHASAAG